MLGIAPIDWLVLAIYFVGTTALGLWTYRKVKSSADYFMGNRSFGKVLMVAQAFGVGTHTDQPVSVAGASYTNGLAGIWYQWIYLFATPFFWIIGPIYRRLRYITMADFFEERYGRSMSVFYTLIGTLYFCMNMGVMLKGTGITIQGLTDGVLREEVVILVSTLLFVSYGLAGGIVAAVVTDLVQGVLILVLSFLLIPFAIHAAGGMGALHAGLPEQMFSLVAPQEVTLFFISMAVLNALVGVVVQPHHMAIGGAGKTEIACRAGWTYGNFLKRLATAGWAFTGIFAAFLYPGLTEETRELAFGITAKNLLPVGMVGLMLAAMIAAVMSTCDAFMVHASALFTQNIYKPTFKPNATDDELLKVGRWASLFIVVGGLAFAFSFDSVISGLKEAWKVTAFLGLAFWFGVSWRRANRYGAWSSAVAMALISVYTGNVLEWSFPAQVAAYLPVGIVLMVLVSRVTKSEPEEKLNHFYALLDTPVGKEDALLQAGIEIKLQGDSSAPAKSSRFEKFLSDPDVDDGFLIVDLFSLRSKFSWKRYRTDIIGFVSASILAFVIVLLVMLVAQIGG